MGSSTAILLFAASASAKGLPPDAGIIRYVKLYRVAKLPRSKRGCSRFAKTEARSPRAEARGLA